MDAVRTDDRVGRDSGKANIAVTQVSLPRLYALRVGYLIMGIGLASVKGPLFLHYDQSWSLMEGIVNCMLLGLSVLAFLGVRYPLQMLPVLLFESVWKLIWLTVVALPLWTADQTDPATQKAAASCLWVVIILAVIPWRYLYAQYVTKRGDRWRSASMIR